MTSWRRMTSRSRHGLGTAGPPRPLQADTPVTWVTKVINAVGYRTSNGRFPKRENRNCTGTFQCHSNNEHAIHSPRSIAGRVGEGGRAARGVSPWSLFCCLRISVAGGAKKHQTAVIFCVSSVANYLPARVVRRPDRRPDLSGGSCCAAGLRSLRFHFGNFASRAWRVISGIRKNIEV